MEEIFKQQRLLDELKRENAELRQQLIDLREGRGIFLDVMGIRFALAAQPPGAPVEPAAPEGEALTGGVSPSLSAPVPRAPVPFPEEGLSEITQIRASIGPLEAQRMKEGPTLAPAYLEELLLDEFTAAATGPIGGLTASSPAGPSSPLPATRESASQEQMAPPSLLDEEKKAALRRELMGSFLLE